VRHGWLERLPDLSEPYHSSPKISHRAWFSPEEYKLLYESTRKRAHEPKQERYRHLSKSVKYFFKIVLNFFNYLHDLSTEYPQGFHKIFAVGTRAARREPRLASAARYLLSS
jgi:hypothetical protein